MALRDEKIAVVGATGVVGIEALRLLEAEGVPPERVVACASDRRVGEAIAYGRGSLAMVSLEHAARAGCGVAIFAASGEVAREWAGRFVEGGAVVVDNSSAFRMDPGTALIVPEVNGHEVAGDRTPRVIANPNCSTIIMLVAVNPLRRAFGCERLDVATYQAASGAGLAAMEELRTQTREVLDGQEPRPRVFPEPCAFNVFSHNSPVDLETGMNIEERKMVEETRKIWDDRTVAVNAMCVRVPVMRTHCEAITAVLGREATEAQVRGVLHGAPGLRVVDDREGGAFPTSLKAAHTGDILVGRIRPDWTREGSGAGTFRAFSMFVAGDQILKGAALNAVQIAHLVVASR